MAGTTLTLQQPTKRKRDYDLTEEMDVERDTRHQTCLECTLSWPWVIFHRNEDGSRNVCPFIYSICQVYVYVHVQIEWADDSWIRGNVILA
jgi:hypothetical protein